MSDQLLWYVTRGSGVVSLVLLSGVVVLGLLTRLRLAGQGWPSFLTPTLHRDLSLLAVAFMALHSVTAITDPFTHLGIITAILPFSSYYRTLWLGLGTVSFLLLLAIVATSLLRGLIGRRVWRGIHWLAYAAWPIAVAHSLGTGSDAFSPWLLAITAVCVAAVMAAAARRLVAAPPEALVTSRRTLARVTGGGK
jgi:sulfoxide reductase heme-binding subunit YedZ